MTFKYLYVQEPFQVNGKAIVYQVGQNLFVVEPLECGVEVVEGEKRKYLFDGFMWKEK